MHKNFDGYTLNHTLGYTSDYTLFCTHIYFIIIIEHSKLYQPKESGMNYSMGTGIIRYIRASKTFSKFRAFRSSVRFEVQCVSKFRALRSSVRFEVPCASKFSMLRSSVCFEVPCASKFRVGTHSNIIHTLTVYTL